MKKLNSLILTTCVLIGFAFAWKQLPAIAESWSNADTKGLVKSKGDLAPDKLLQKLNLSEEQKKKIARIFGETNSKIFQILNPEQRKKLEAGIKSKQNVEAIISSLNLSAEQKQRIGGIVTERRNQILAILTPEQKKKLADLVNNK
ncbi:MAG: Spy/CpxP family protein refolding chaperone [Pseudanabaena sp.]